MFSSLLVLAEQSPDPSAAPPGGSTLIGFLPLLLIGVLGYFLMIRPMKRQEHQRQTLLSALKKNDRVVTSGGIIGIVAAIKDKEEEVTLKVDESSNVRLRVTKSSIVRILGGEDAAKEQKETGA
jgi:preprotein translocase subunit YajC